ncbi:MAG: hypothetical protein LBU45_06705 [Azoarcus sp.]|jgi:NitT/TauT family transport system permease protein|nr:hypothetical protein [Azoarcus sp.]
MNPGLTFERLPIGSGNGNVEAATRQSSGISVLYPPDALRAQAVNDAPAAGPGNAVHFVPAFRFYWFGLAAVAAWGLLGAIALLLPDKPVGFNESWAYTREFGLGALGFAAVWAALTVLASFRQLPRAIGRGIALFRHTAPWIVAVALILALWEVLTAKLALLEPPFFAPPSALIEAYIGDNARLADSAWN